MVSRGKVNILDKLVAGTAIFCLILSFSFKPVYGADAPTEGTSGGESSSSSGSSGSASGSSGAGGSAGGAGAVQVAASHLQVFFAVHLLAPLRLFSLLRPSLACRRVALVEHDRTGRPTVWECLPVEFVEQSGKSCSREAGNGERAQMGLPELRFETAGQRLVGKQRIEMHRGFGNAYIVQSRRDAAVKIAQGLAIIEPLDLRKEPFEQAQQPVGPIGEALEKLARIHAFLGLSFVEPAFSPRGILGRRHP